MPPGPASDAQGRPAVDSTANVTAIVKAAVKRMDDLRRVEVRHFTEMLHQQKDFEKLRAEYEGQLRSAETARIDAIRAVDVGAVNRAAEVAATQASTLAAQVSVSAETLRTQVAAAASAATIALAAALEPVQKDIAELRKTQYEQAGQRLQVIEGRSAAGATTASRTLLIGGLSLAVAFLAMVSTGLGLYLGTETMTEGDF